MIRVDHPFLPIPDPAAKGRVADPDWIRIQSGQWIRIRNPGSGSGSRRAKITQEVDFFFKFMFSSVGWPLLRAEGFFCNLDVLYGGLGIGKL
jgi:hypothetical protein